MFTEHKSHTESHTVKLVKYIEFIHNLGAHTKHTPSSTCETVKPETKRETEKYYQIKLLKQNNQL